jgi:hypothetical protein
LARAALGRIGVAGCRRPADLVELQTGHRTGGVLQQDLVHPQLDLFAGREPAIQDVLGQDLLGQRAAHYASSTGNVGLVTTSRAPSGVSVKSMVAPSSG